jgi:hypothetical protein
VCPSQALLFVRKDEVANLRHNKPLRDFLIGSVRVKTKNAIMVPDPDTPLHLDAALLINDSQSIAGGL